MLSIGRLTGTTLDCPALRFITGVYCKQQETKRNATPEITSGVHELRKAPSEIGGVGQNSPLLPYGKRCFSIWCVGFRDGSRPAFEKSTPVRLQSILQLLNTPSELPCLSVLRNSSLRALNEVHPAMQTVEPGPMQRQTGWLANSLTVILAFLAFLAGFGGRLFGLWLVAWNVLPTPFDPVWPVECLLAGPLALIALTSAVILRRRSSPSRLLSLATVLSIVTLLWSSLCGYFVLYFDGGSV